MRSLRSAATLSSVAVLAASLATAPGASAQDPGVGPACAMVTADEANAIFTGANLVLADNSSGYYCSFDGAFNLTISVMTDTDLAEGVDGFGEGEAVTVAGGPGWFQESSGNLAVPANRSVVFMNGWGSADTGAEMLALMSGLAELIIPRIPPGPDPAVVEQLTALLPSAVAPDTIAAVPGWYLVPVGDLGTPERQALQGLLATQGRTTTDLVLVTGSDGSGGGVYLAHVPGVDPSALVMLLLNAIMPGAAAAPVSLVDIGGRQVTRIETQPPVFAFVLGDAAVYAFGSEAFVQSLREPTP